MHAEEYSYTKTIKFDIYTDIPRYVKQKDRGL